MVALVHYVWLGVVLAAIAFMVSWLAYPLVRRMAIVWKIMDCPDARKLQKHPVPVMGCMAVFCGIVASTAVLLTISWSTKPFLMLVAMALLMILGIIDDKVKLSAWLRLLVEICVITVLLVNGNMIDSFRGLWGIGELPVWASYALSILAGTGIINAFNLIDGVDGCSSGFVSLACALFGIIFYISGTQFMAITCLICVGSVLPFFLHNVFGQKTKMFIGNGGTLMMGVMITVFVFSIIKGNSQCINVEKTGLALIPFVLAVLSIPVFDTLRVMFWRIFRGVSPFYAEKTHLHHSFISLGFSHLSTTVSMLLLDMMVVGSQLLAWKAGASAEIQLYIVVAMGILCTLGTYSLITWQVRIKGKIYHFLRKISEVSRTLIKPLREFLRKLTDGELFKLDEECTM